MIQTAQTVADLTARRDRLETRRAELEGQLIDLDAELERLHQDHETPVSALVDAEATHRTTLGVLERIEAEIAAVDAQLVSAEATAEREGVLSELTRHANDGAKYHRGFETALEEANVALGEHAQRLATAWLLLLESRSDFLTAGRPLAHLFGMSDTPRSWDHERDQAERAKAQAVLDEVTARGADVSYVLTRYDGRQLSALDLITSPHDPAFPEPFGAQLGAALHIQLWQPKPE